jgi:polyferredoxin
MKLRLLRWAAQASAFAVSNVGLNLTLKTGCPFPYLFCYGCPFASAGCPVGSLQHFVALRLLPFYLIGMIGIYGLFFGRAFCGWACPFGALHDLLSVRAKRKAKSVPHAKFMILGLVLILAWVTVDTYFCKFCPAGSLFAAIPAPFFYQDLQLSVFFYIHLLTLALTVGVALILSRFWCRYLCPYGTVGVFNRISLVTIAVSPECDECNKCLEACQMGIRDRGFIGRSTDCTLCGRCVDACTSGKLKFARRSFAKDV